MSVPCAMPDRDDYDYDEPPEQYGAWRTLSGRCDHAYCQEADWYRRAYSRVPRQPSKAEMDEMNADLELVMSETGGRGF